MAAARFAVQIRGDVVVVVGQGAPEFQEANNALADAIAAPGKHSKKILFDHRLVDLSNYYGFIVRHAEVAPALGLDSTFRIAHLGTRVQDEVLSYMVDVGRNRGWNVRCFMDFDAALQWLGG
jgi:hypothetical protein